VTQLGLPADFILVQNELAWIRLGRRFDVVGSGGRGFMAPWIQPVTQVDPLLAVPTIADATEDISAGGGVYTVYFTVPTRKRWHLRWINKPATVANTKVRMSTGVVTIDLSLSNTTGTPAGVDLTLDEGWTVGLTTTGNAGDNAVLLGLVYDEEDAY